MKNLKLYAVIIAIFWSLPAFAQVDTTFVQAITSPPLKADWNRVYIENVGSIDLPPTMEVQGGKYKEFSDNMLASRGFIDSSQLIAQQRGLNEYNEQSKKYARIMLKTDMGKYGDYEKLNFNINNYTKTDIDELDTIFKKEMQQQLSEASRLDLGKLKLIEWYPLKLKRINGMSCFHISYIRQMNDNPLVIVDMYLFDNNDRVHILTMSYKLSEVESWKNDFTHVLDSFRISNVR